MCVVVAEAVVGRCGTRESLEALEGFPELPAEVEEAGDVIRIDEVIDEELTPRLIVMKVTTLKIRKKIYLKRFFA